MPPEPRVLAFDTSAAHCAAALLWGERVLAQRVEPMATGQAERLVPLLEEMLAQARLTWPQIDLIVVGTGPGNFTGIRIAVALARGLALGLGVPAVGVTGFEALGEEAPACVPAARGQFYLKAPGQAPRLVEAVPAGTRALAALAPGDFILALARAGRARAASAPPARPAPFYLRGAEAAPLADPPPVILP